MTALLILLAAPPEYPPVVFPPGCEGVVNVRDLGAVGDGVADDTEAIQKALDLVSGDDREFCGIAYVPDGTYRVTKALVANRGRKGSGTGPWLWGQSREGTVVRLDDGVNEGKPFEEQSEEDKEKNRPRKLVGGVTSVLQLHPFDGGVRTSANWFMRDVRHLTIDVGDNPDVDGVRYHATNSGLLQDLRITGKGRMGINCEFLGESGPNMIEDVEVDGFDIGIGTRWCYGQTVVRARIRDCRQIGLRTTANVMGVEDLVVTGTPRPVHVEMPKNWHWWSGVVGLVGGELRPSGENAAILNEGKLYLRGVDGPEPLVESAATKASPVSAGSQYASHPPRDAAMGEAGLAGDFLPVKAEPTVPWEADFAKWVMASEHGAAFNDRKDDTAALQAAVDAAAAKGATVVALPPTPRGAAAWLNMEGDVRIHGSVRHVIGLGWTRILGPGSFVVGEDAADLVCFEHVYSFGGRPVRYVNAADSTLVCRSLSGKIVGEGSGDIFVTNCPSGVELKGGQSLWARSLNSEGKAEDGSLNVNAGGNLWVMGTKSEGSGTRFLTTGGRTEVYGAYEYTNVGVEPEDRRPIFAVDGGSLFVGGWREYCHVGKPYVVKLRVGERELDREAIKGRETAVLVAGEE